MFLSISSTRGDYRRAERHLAEAACVYSRCTPAHDVRGKVALCTAHLYVTGALRDTAQAKRYLHPVGPTSILANVEYGNPY